MVNTKLIHYGESWYTASLIKTKKCTFKVRWLLCTTHIPALFQKITWKMTVTKLYKKISTSWPHEHPGLNCPLAFITVSQKQEQEQLVESAEEQCSLWCAPLHRDSSAFPILHLPWETCLSNCLCFQSCLQDAQTSCDAQDCHRMERQYFFLNLHFLHTVLYNTGGTQRWYCGFMSRIYD